MKRAREDGGTGAPGVKRVKCVLPRIPPPGGLDSPLCPKHCSQAQQRPAPVPAQGGRLTTTDALNYLRCVHVAGHQWRRQGRGPFLARNLGARNLLGAQPWGAAAPSLGCATRGGWHQVPGGWLLARKGAAALLCGLGWLVTEPTPCASAPVACRTVKQTFSDNKGVYDQFLEVMKQFKAQQCVPPGCDGPQPAQCRTPGLCPSPHGPPSHLRPPPPPASPESTPTASFSKSESSSAATGTSSSASIPSSRVCVLPTSWATTGAPRARHCASFRAQRGDVALTHACFCVSRGTRSSWRQRTTSLRRCAARCRHPDGSAPHPGALTPPAAHPCICSPSRSSRWSLTRPSAT